MIENYDGKTVNITCTFAHGKNKKGFGGHWEMVYTVWDVITEDGFVLADEYDFRGIKGFKRRGFKNGDKLSMTVKVKIEGVRVKKVKLTYPKNIEVIEKW